MSVPFASGGGQGHVRSVRGCCGRARRDHQAGAALDRQADGFAGLRERGLPIGILTRNRKDNAWAVARKHGLHFDAVVGREDGPVKPDSFGVLHLCRGFAVEPAQTLLVGDYLFDLLCARAAGAIPVLIANHERADEFAAHADYTVTDLLELLPIVDRCNDAGDSPNHLQEN